MDGGNASYVNRWKRLVIEKMDDSLANRAILTY